MPIYKEEKNNTWYVRVYVKTLGKDGRTVSTQKLKRGFKTRKEAKQWESQILASTEVTMNILVKDFMEIYFEDKKYELKDRTIKNKRYIMEEHVIPYFGQMSMDKITPADIIKWQNRIRELGYSETYLRMIQNQLTALFTHASNIYTLSNNPCKKVKKMGRSDAKELSFWTKDEYDKFINTFEVGDKYYVLFEILFWCGLREGEALALTAADIYPDRNQISVNKTYYRANGQDIITSPKTENSVRFVDVPAFLIKEITDYINSLYKYPKTARLFPVTAEAVQHVMKRHTEKIGLNKIRVHDLRHSHVAYLINQGVAPLIIKNRLGHNDIKITLNTYGHLYPNEQQKVAEMLNMKK